MRSSLTVLSLLLAMAACKKSEPSLPPGSQLVQQTPPGAPGLGAVRGKVLERIDAAPYSYLRLSTPGGEVWAAVPQTTTAAGTEVAIEGPMPMDGFESKTLKRKFDKIYFGQLAGAAASPAMPAMGASAQAAPGQAGGATGAPQGVPPGVAAQHAAAAGGPADVGEVKVPKAQGADARTVAELWAQKAALKEKVVTVRGKVVKYNVGIMGRNWLHLRDGTGAQSKGDNDVTVTTSDSAAVGDVVVAKGIVRLDKDFGAGYAYPVIVEEAKLAK
jgi:hypothetical protein